MGGRRQGIDFFVVPDSPPDKQVRMDVAAFVGFASAGPVDTPVAVEDAAYFEEIFGPDQPLAWNQVDGQMQYGHLGAAVRAFFRNGGTRCWVIRVARDPETNRFPVPGLMQVFASEPGQVPAYRGVELPARSPGSWSDWLEVGTVLESRTLGTARALDAGLIEVTQPVRSQISPGDLLRMTPSKPGLLLCLAVDSAAEQPPDAFGVTRWLVRGQEFWFRTDGDLPASAAGTPAEVTLLKPNGESRVIVGPNFWYPPEGGVTAIAVQDQELAAVGNLLAVRTQGTEPAGGPPLLVSAFQVETERVQSDNASPYAMQIKGTGSLQPISPQDGRTQAGADLGPVEGLSFTIWTQAEDGSYRKAEGLSFTPDGSRYPGRLPSDEQLFQAEDERRPGDLNAADPFWASLILPRFPLAGPGRASVSASGVSYPILLPIGMPAAMRPEIAAEAVHTDGPPLLRDGLAWADDLSPKGAPRRSFLYKLFLDPDLAEAPTAELLATAFTKRHVAMQKLRGIHAVIPLEEATLLCVPDLAHFRWNLPLAGWSVMPNPLQVSLERNRDGSLWLTWPMQYPPGHKFTVEIAADPDFRTGVHRAEASGAGWSLLPEFAAGRRYFRVRAEYGGRKGPWSNTVVTGRPPGDFAPLEPEVSAPKLRVESHLNSHELLWDTPVGAPRDPAVTYRLELDQDPGFSSPIRYYEGPELQVSIWQAGDTRSYLRVRAIRERYFSPWSNTVVIRPMSEQLPHRTGFSRTEYRMQELRPEHFPDDRKARAPIHLALLRLCRARGDLFGILSLPVHYPDDEVIRYTHALTALAGIPEAGSLTYGALYVPWLWAETSPGEERLIPPDGPVTGMIAALSMKPGVWHPPAYQELLGVSFLHHESPQDSYAALLNEGINVVINPPGRIVVRSAHSLSQDDRLRMISVRRLMMLVRRLAVQEGMELIFQPNTEGLRQSARMRFERLLNDLFVRGAFAGATPAESYRVTIDPALNSPAVQEQGRLVIELDVAPVQPLVFMTVRLMQDEGRELVVSEV